VQTAQAEPVDVSEVGVEVYSKIPSHTSGNRGNGNLQRLACVRTARQAIENLI
jgi:hypothetical protein